MASKFVVEFTEDLKRKVEIAEIGLFDGDTKQAERTIQRIWAGALPGRTEIVVTSVVGAGVVSRVPSLPSSTEPAPGDAEIIAKGIARAEKAK